MFSYRGDPVVGDERSSILVPLYPKYWVSIHGTIQDC